MHILLLNQPFHPDVVATAQHLWDLARYLAESGHRVSVICSRMFYGTTQLHDKGFERIGPIEIHRVGGTRLGKRSLRHRIADFASFYLAAAAKMQQIARPDAIVALTTPPMISLLAALHKQFHCASGGRRPSFIYYVMDLYPDVAVASGLLAEEGPAQRVLKRMTARTLQLADATIVLGRDMRQRVLETYPRHAAAERVAVIPPWADRRELFPIDRRDNPLAGELGLRETFNIVYSGNLGIAHDLETLLGAIDITRNDEGLRWLFIGAGKRIEALRERTNALAWPHVIMLPYQPRERLRVSLNLADVHLVSQLPRFTGLVVPSKLFGILAVGRPAIMVGPPDAECSRIIRENGAGYVVENGNSEELVARVRSLRADPAAASAIGRRGREAFERKYERAIACRRITEVIESTVR